MNYYELTSCIENSVDPDLELHCFQEKRADQDPHCLQELIYIWFHTAFKRIICLSNERYKLIFFFWTSKIFYGQVLLGFLLAPGQVNNFTISTPRLCKFGNLIPQKPSQL